MSLPLIWDFKSTLQTKYHQSTPSYQTKTMQHTQKNLARIEKVYQPLHDFFYIAIFISTKKCETQKNRDLYFLKEFFLSFSIFLLLLLSSPSSAMSLCYSIDCVYCFVAVFLACAFEFWVFWWCFGCYQWMLIFWGWFDQGPAAWYTIGYTLAYTPRVLRGYTTEVTSGVVYNHKIYQATGPRTLKISKNSALKKSALK